MVKPRIAAGFLILMIIAVLGVGYMWHRHSQNKNGKAVPASAHPFKIGGILPLTGDLSALAEQINRGALIAVDEAKNRSVAIDYIPEDDQYQPKYSVTAATKLIDQDHADAVFTATVEETHPMAKQFDDGQTPLLVSWDSNDLLKSAGPYIFSSGFSTEAAGQRMADFAYDHGWKRVAIMDQKNEWSELIAAAFRKRFEERRGVVALFEQTSLAENDFRTVLAKVKNARVDALYAPIANIDMQVTLLQQANQLKVPVKFMYGDGFQQVHVNQAGVLAEGVYSTNSYGVNLATLAQKYKAKYGTEPTDPVFVGFGYDAINTLIAAHDISLSQHLSLKDALARVKLSGAINAIDFNGGQFSEKQEKLYIVRNGTFEEVAK